MAVNRYDRPADAPIINTYVPIDFNQLYRIGITQKQAIDEAAEELGEAIQTFGEFRSPSRIDTENYYNQTLGVLRPYIEAAAADPDRMKDAGFRSAVQSAINGLDYAKLSLLREGAANLRQREANVAKMIAEGTYNPNWDNYADISNYDTLNSGVLTELAPIAWMSANELSDAYFNNLKPTDLGQVTRNGVRYNRTGISYDTLYGIADARFNDLVRTPQGAMYYRDLLQANNDDPEAARQAFVGMIADSQRDRLVDEYDVDPAWFLQARLAASRYGSSQIVQTNPTRLDLINQGINSRTDQVFKSNVSKYYTPEQQQEIAGQITALNQQYQLALARYQQTGSDEDLVAVYEAEDALNQARYSIVRDTNRQTMLDTFRDHAHFSAQDGEESDEYVRENYRIGVQAALDEVSAPISLNQQDALFTTQGGAYKVDSDEFGTNTDAYGFKNSSGFLLPETIFSGYTGVSRSQGRRDISWTANTELTFQQLFENGSLNSVTFTPDNSVIRTGNGQLAVRGTVRIPVDEVERKVGTGTLYRPFFVGSERTDRALKELYGVQKVERKVGDNNIEYFEFKAYKTLPPENGTAPESITAIDQSWFNTNTYGGIGSASLAGGNYYNSASRALNAR